MAQETVHIDFDDLSAPCDIGSAQPLHLEYADLGVEFFNGGQGDLDGSPVLGECSGYGVPGYSPPNFAVVGFTATMANGGNATYLYLLFTDERPHRVRARIGGTPGSTARLECQICPWGLGCDRVDVHTLGSTMQTFEVDAGASEFALCTVEGPYPPTPQDHWIIDDIELDFQQQATPVPGVSLTGTFLLVMLIAGLGVWLARRGRA
jgi:hypothetical protein